MANEVQRVGVGLIGSLRQMVEVDATLFEAIYDLASFVGIGPLAA